MLSKGRTDLAIFLRWLAARELGLLAVKRADIDRYRDWLSELVDGDGEPAAHGQPRFAPRVSEITRAQAADLEPEAGGGHSLLITGKGGKRYRVPLNASTERALVAHLDGAATDSCFVVPTGAVAITTRP